MNEDQSAFARTAGTSKRGRLGGKVGSVNDGGSKKSGER